MVRVGIVEVCVTSSTLRVLLSRFWVSGSQVPSPMDPVPGSYVSGPQVPGLRVPGSQVLKSWVSGFRVLVSQSLGSRVSGSIETPTQVFSCEYCEIFNNTYFEEHLRMVAFVTCRCSCSQVFYGIAVLENFAKFVAGSPFSMKLPVLVIIFLLFCFGQVSSFNFSEKLWK